MRIIEWIVVLINLIIGIISAITDIKKHIIPNKMLYPAFGLLFPLGLMIHIQAGKGCLYLQNVLFVIVLAVLLFAAHYFSAGDSKLIIVLGLAIPVRLYEETLPGFFPITTWVIVIFSTAFVYLVAESFLFTLKKQKRFHNHCSLGKTIKDYSIRLIIVTAFNECIWFLFPSFYAVNHYLIILIDYFLIVFLSGFLPNINYLFAAALAVAELIFGFICGYLNGFRFSVLLYIPFVLLFGLLQSFLSGYNYQNIATSSIKSGMILSLESSLLMQHSKIKGMPSISTEDLRSKLTEEEVESIHRWAISKPGKQEISIVRTLPFGALIAIGTAIFILERSISFIWGS